jgi:hypothetical protein
MKNNPIASALLDEMQKRLEESSNEFKKTIIKRFIKILEEYV